MSSPPFTKPRRLVPGMTIGVVAPSSPLRDPRLAEGIRRLEAASYTVVEGAHLHDGHAYLAGPDAARANDLTTMFADPAVDAVFCARGGYGACRMVELVDWEVVRAHPKVFVGYSDITTLHLAFERRAHLATFHGPMVVTLGGDLSADALDCFWRAVGGAEPLGALPAAGAPLRTLVGGTARGRLAGGCLALLGAALGTCDAPDFAGRLVLIEDVGEALYRVDRLIVQLLRSGAFHDAAGFVIGNATGWDSDMQGPPAMRIEDLWRDLIAPLGKPAIHGFPFGHEPNPLTLPLGCMAELDADAQTLTVLEPAVR